jgi:tetratricopeptide (TPR) repeat protein
MNRTAEATQSFQKAAEKDPRYFEAWMNFAAINLAFRGYDEAARGYKAASEIRPKEYDSKLGYAVAVRGQLDYNLTSAQMIQTQMFECANSLVKWEEAQATGSAKGPKPNCDALNTQGPAQIKEYRDKFVSLYTAASAAYDAAIQLDGNRPEALYDQALLVDKYEDKKLESCDQPCQIAAGEKTLDLYQKFHDKFLSTTDERVKKMLTDNDRQITNVKGKLDLIKLKAPEAAPATAGSTPPAAAPSASASK